MGKTDRLVCAVAVLAAVSAPALGQEKLHFTYLWHMEQPIYWPDEQRTNLVGLGDRYERLAESLSRGGVHPLNNLNDIFGLPDRVAGYQYRMRDSISAFGAFPSSGSAPEAGAQISFSGGLIENLFSVGGTGHVGGAYSANWYGSLRQARGWTTFNGAAVPRADIVVFPFHHALMPLIDESAMRKEIQTYKAIYPDAWGAGAVSRGFFPSEMAFSERMIGVLADEGIEWSIVSGEKVSRACANFPVVLGSGGINCDPPNRADQMNPSQANYFRQSIDRGCAPAEAYPFAFTPHRARYVDPNTGAEKRIIVVPASQSLGWKDGYGPQGIADFDTLNAQNDPSRPMLVMLAHDGDNAWGGGYSYYMEATPNRVGQARGAGYVPTVVQRYLADHPVPAGDVVHVEDGAWVNADGDFGAPQFLNWNWPLLNGAGQIDIANGWHEDERNWAVITAAQNHVDTAEQIWRDQGGTVDARKIVYPETGANGVERAWHYYLGSLNSGYMYYGTSVDMEVKPTVACNNAVRCAMPTILSMPVNADRTGPTVWIPQRHPWNPGSTNFGPQYGYMQSVNNGDFWVWTFAYDVDGVSHVSLKYRVDGDGMRSLTGTENETYAGGAGVGAWQTLAMNRRVFPAGNVYNNPSIDFFVMPTAIADEYSVQVTGLRSVLVDYYVEAVDSIGNVKKSPIQHVWIGDGSGATGGGSACDTGVVTTTPCPPAAGQSVTIRYDAAGRNLAGAASVAIHIGYNGWTNVTAPDPVMTRVGTSSVWTYTYTVPAGATVIDCVFNNTSGTWDNNGGADWHMAVTAAPPVSGSCCVASMCAVTTQSACTGTFTAGGSCTTACPTPPVGACCVGGGCTSVVQSACAAGTWTSGGACVPSPCAFVMDGAVDGDTTVVAQNGAMWVRAALRGDVLYVAAPNTPAGNDRFIYLSPASGPGAMQAANWGKAGQVAGWSALLGAEADNGYIGWQDQTVGAATGAAKGAVIEGTINLRQEFVLGSGPLPESVWVAFAQYPTGNGAAVVSGLQVPASADGDGNIQGGEFVRVRLCSLRAGGCCPADFNGAGGVNVQDIFDFLGAWFAADPRSDFNQTGGTTVQDIFDFLAAWFVGC